LDFNLISVFPPTYKNRKNGLRVDLATALKELHPVSHIDILVFEQ
jgi:alpha-N-arabinofuranosidase